MGGGRETTGVVGGGVDRTEGRDAQRAREGAARFCWRRNARGEREDGSGDPGDDCPEEGKAGEHPPHRDGGQSRQLFFFGSCGAWIELAKTAETLVAGTGKTRH